MTATTEVPAVVEAPARRDPRALLRQQAQRGAVATSGAPVAATGETQAIAGGGASSPAPAKPPVPGVFTTPLPPPPVSHVSNAAAASAPQPDTAAAPVPAKLSSRERLRAASIDDADVRQARKSMAAMKTLTRLLEAVYTRPGSAATDAERMVALQTLSVRAHELGAVVARVAGEDADRSQYIQAMCMDAAVSLVTKSWEQSREIDWATLIEAASNTPEVSQAAEELSHAVYSPVATQQDASDRLSISMHAAFWQIYSLGDLINGITARVSAEVVRDCANYLQKRDKFVTDNDLHVSWMQGSIRRMADLFCAEMKARFSQTEAPNSDDVESVLAVVRSGFEGVENYAQSILEKPSHIPSPQPTER